MKEKIWPKMGAGGPEQLLGHVFGLMSFLAHQNIRPYTGKTNKNTEIKFEDWPCGCHREP